MGSRRLPEGRAGSATEDLVAAGNTKTACPREISALVLIPEGIGTYWRCKSTLDAFTRGTWLVADSGYLTLDTVLVRNGNYIQDSAKSDNKTGLSLVAEELRQFVFTKSRANLDRTQIDAAMVCDVIQVNGRDVLIKPVRDAALDELAKRASLLIEQAAEGQNLTGVVLTGGGAFSLINRIKFDHLPAPTLPPGGSPHRANVIGAATYLEAGLKNG